MCASLNHTHTHTHTLSQDAGVGLARAASLPIIINLVIYGVVYTALGIIVFADRISETRLLVYSIVFWVVMVLELYMWFSLQTVPKASNTVSPLFTTVYQPSSNMDTTGYGQLSWLQG